MRNNSLLLPGLLLPQAAAVHSVRLFSVVLRLLLPQAVAVHSVRLFSVVLRLLLPQTVAVVLLAGQRADSPLSAGDLLERGPLRRRMSR